MTGNLVGAICSLVVAVVALAIGVWLDHIEGKK